MRLLWWLLMHICWCLEDMADRIHGVEKAADFYPSARWENKLWGLPQHGRPRRRRP